MSAKVFADHGTKVTCEGPGHHHIATVVEPLTMGGRCKLEYFEWEIERPKEKGLVEWDQYRCPHCDALWMLPGGVIPITGNNVSIHLETGWNPPSTADYIGWMHKEACRAGWEALGDDGVYRHKGF